MLQRAPHIRQTLHSLQANNKLANKIHLVPHLLQPIQPKHNVTKAVLTGGQPAAVQKVIKRSKILNIKAKGNDQQNVGRMD